MLEIVNKSGDSPQDRRGQRPEKNLKIIVPKKKYLKISCNCIIQISASVGLKIVFILMLEDRFFIKFYNYC